MAERSSAIAQPHFEKTVSPLLHHSSTPMIFRQVR
jgi:hypothetical protein